MNLGGRLGSFGAGFKKPEQLSIGCQSIRTVAWLIVVSAMTFGASGLLGQDESILTTNSKLVTGRKLDRQNEVAISVWWPNAKLKPRLSQLSQHQNAGIFLDRNVDPTKSVSAGDSQLSLEQFLWKFAADHQMGVCRVEDFYYLGPRANAVQLPVVLKTIANETIKQRKKYAVKWTAKDALKTTDPVIPAQLLKSLASKHGFTIVNLELLPHDVWAGFELPETSLQARLQMVLIGFGKTFQRSADGKQVQLIDLPKMNQETRKFRFPSGAKQLIAELGPQFPALKLKRSGKSVTATGDPDRIYEFEAQLIAAKPVKKSGKKTYKIEFENTRLAILRGLAAQTGKNLVLG